MTFCPERPPRCATSAWVKSEAARCAAKWARSVGQSVMVSRISRFVISGSTRIRIAEIPKENF